MLDDLRAMLFVSERRHHGELAAAQADRALHAIAAKGVSGHRAQFAAQAPAGRCHTQHMMFSDFFPSSLVLCVCVKMSAI